MPCSSGEEARQAVVGQYAGVADVGDELGVGTTVADVGDELGVGMTVAEELEQPAKITLTI
jgi:hypothetical protein